MQKLSALNILHLKQNCRDLQGFKQRIPALLYMMDFGSLELWKNNKSLNIMDQQNWIKKEEEKEKEEVKIKLTKYGFFLDLFAFASFSSVIGIVISLLIIFGGLAKIVVINTGMFETSYYDDELVICMLMPNIIFNIIYLVMWTLLKMKTNHRNINGIQRITEVYCYCTAFLEIKGMIVMILFGVMILISSSDLLVGIGMIIVAPFGLFFAFMKIHGIMVKESKWIGIYLGSRYPLFIICLVSLIIITMSHYHYHVSMSYNLDFVSVSLLIGSMVLPYLIIDMCLTIILHSIIADKEKG